MEAYGDLVLAHQGYLHGLCLAILGDPHEAEDAAQGAFIKAYKALPAFAGQAKFRTWLTRIAVNQCKDRIRQLRRRRMVSLDASLEAGQALPPALVHTPEAPLAPSPAIPLEVLERLSQGEQELLRLLQADDTLSYDDLGRTLGLSLDSVKGRLKRARQKLRHFWKPADV